nr:MAG TPA: Ponericin [Caudoviricetes sp.]
MQLTLKDYYLQSCYKPFREWTKRKAPGLLK